MEKQRQGIRMPLVPMPIVKQQVPIVKQQVPMPIVPNIIGETGRK